MNTINRLTLSLKDRAAIEYATAIAETNKLKIEYIAKALGIDLSKMDDEEEHN